MKGIDSLAVRDRRGRIMESGFERLLFKLYTDQQFRNAVRENPMAYGQRYSLSEKELEALTKIPWEAFPEEDLSLIEPQHAHGRAHNY
jgi:hypothetical protein